MQENEKKAISYLNIFAVLLVVAIILAFLPLMSIIPLILGIVSIVILMLAFRNLLTIDNNFKTPYIFTLISFIGLIIIIAALFVMIGGDLLSLGLSTTAIYMLPLIGFFGGLAIILIAGVILELIGGIAGVILGLYRVGKRYNKTGISVGAVLLVFPLVDIAGLILIIIGLLKLSK
ncbi:MAG: DUF973 family protein [Candidatus Parvarchaeota archaeon]|nr:DUF973 family protein [Candidatus Parvarchaeota archaeon]